MSAADVTAPLAVVPTTGDRGARLDTGPVRFVFLDLLRAAAALLVVYSHVARFWQGAGVSSPVVGTIDHLVGQPLRLEQEFGYFGVALFFLVSGFVVTHRASRERTGEFAVKRVLRIYPVLLVVVLVVGLVEIPAHVVVIPGAPALTPYLLLTNGLLLNYLIVPQVVLVEVAWTLIIEVLFYLMLVVLVPLIRRSMWITLAVELAVCVVAVWLARDVGADFFVVAVSLSYLPVLLLGQVCWAVSSGRLPLWAGGVLGGCAWVIYLWAGSRNMGRIDDGYGNAVALGLLVFVLGLLAEPRLRPNRIAGFVADRSYSLYLWHWAVAVPILGVLRHTVPAPIATLAALAATAVVVEGSYRFLEAPSRRLARRITRRPTRRGSHR